MTTENNTINVPVSEADLKVQYNDYIVECATLGVKPKTFHEWKSQGMILTPAELKKATTGSAATEKAPKAIGKADIGRQIFSEELHKVGYDLSKLVRKDVIKRYTTDPLFATHGLGCLTAAGAATYYANNSLAFKKDPTKFQLVEEVESEVEDETTEMVDEEIQYQSQVVDDQEEVFASDEEEFENEVEELDV